MPEAINTPPRGMWHVFRVTAAGDKLIAAFTYKDHATSWARGFCKNWVTRIVWSE